MDTIRLDFEDLLTSALDATMRQVRAIKKKRVGNDHGGTSGRSISIRLADSIIGELGERAVAKKIDRYHTRGSGQTTDYGDVGGEDEVRATERQGGGLIIYNDDHNAARYFLAIIDFHQQGVLVTLPGWVYGREAKKEKYWRSDFDPPCYLMPQKDLKAYSRLQEYDAVF